MNRLLADTLGFINGLLAVVIVLAGALVGYSGTLGTGNRILGLVVGSVAGLLIAGSLCGLIAFLVLIEGHLRTLAGAAPRSASPDFEQRREPRL